MSRRVRIALFGISGAGLLAVLLIGFRALPPFGDFHGAYGLLVDRIEPKLRHATDIVTALNFDLRAFDTLGEEFILFASVAGVALLLRTMRSQDDDARTSRSLDTHRFAGSSDALRLTSVLLLPLLIALGIYLALHGALTPGGGFQAGIVLAAGPLVTLLGGRYLALRRLAPEWALEALESAGAAGYAAIGLAGLIFTGVYIRNMLPLGIPDHLLSAGMMPLNSVAVGLEVTGAFLLIWTEFLDQAVVVSRDEL